MWHKPVDNTIYWWSQAEDVYLNEDASDMFNLDSTYSSNGHLIDIDLRSIITSRTKNMKQMFASSFEYNNHGYISNINFSDFDTKNVTDMSGMFHGQRQFSGIDLSNFDTSKVTDMSRMFTDSKFSSLNLSSFNTSKVINMSGMFKNMVEILLLNLSSFDTRKVVDMSNMFSNLIKVRTIKATNNFVVDQVYYDSFMFYDNHNLVGGNSTVYSWNLTNKQFARIDTPGTPGFFTQGP